MFDLKKTMTTSTLGVLGVALLVLAGCGRGPDPSSASRSSAQNGDYNPFTAPATDVLVEVNGQPITCGEFQARVNLERGAYRLKRAKSRKKPEELARELDVYIGRRAGHFLPVLVNQLLVRRTFESVGLKFDEKEIAAEMARNCSTFGLKKGDEENLAKALGTDRAYLRDQLLDPLRQRKLRLHYDPACTNLTEREIDEGLARQTKHYARAVASNAVTYVTCSNVLAQIRGGMDFAAAGRKYGMVEVESAAEGETFDPEDFDEIDNPTVRRSMQALKKWAFSAPLGSVTGPVEMEDGLSIVKLLERQGALAKAAKPKGEDESEAELEAEVRLARITFVMLEPEPEPRTREYVRQALLKWKENRAQKAMIAKVQDGMNLVYPHGTNFVFRAASAPVQTAPKTQAKPKTGRPKKK